MKTSTRTFVFIPKTKWFGYVLIFAVCSLSFSAFAQSDNPINTALSEGTDQPEFVNANPAYLLPITVHIIRRSDGSNGVRVQELLDNFCVTQHYFENHRFYPVLHEIKYIDRTDVYDDPTQSFTYLRQQYNPNTLNVFTVWSTGLAGYNLGAFYSPQEDIIMLPNLAINSNRNYFGHELGHCFDLADAYAGLEFVNGEWTTGECQDGSNCTTTGDFICDTPPDYGMNFGENCEFTDSIYDPCGALIDPEEHLVMGSFNDCDPYSYFFSPQQIEKMENDFFTEERDYLRQINAGILSEVTETPNIITPQDEGTTTFYNVINIEWDPVPNATHYLVELSRNSEFSVQLRDTITTSTTLQFTTDSWQGLGVPRRTIYLRVRPYNGNSMCAAAPKVISFELGLFSNTRDVNAELSFDVFPNPVGTADPLTVRINGKGEVRQVNLTLFNAIGEPLSTVNHQSVRSTYEHSFDVGNFAPGLYFVQLKTDVGSTVRKVIIE